MAISCGIITINEARQKENLPPLPPEEGADHPIVNGSYVRLSDVGAAYGRNLTSNNQNPGQEQQTQHTQQPQPEKQSKPANPDENTKSDDEEQEEQEAEKGNKKHTERKKQRKSERRGK